MKKRQIKKNQKWYMRRMKDSDRTDSFITAVQMAARGESPAARVVLDGNRMVSMVGCTGEAIKQMRDLVRWANNKGSGSGSFLVMI